jgi:uncharacterized protein
MYHLMLIAILMLIPLQELHAQTEEKRMTTPLIEAAENNDIVAIEQLLLQGNLIDERDAKGRTALLAATHAARIEAADLLISKGADVNAKDSIQDSPYLYAAAEGPVEILVMTLTAGADLKSTNRYGGTGLIPASHHGLIDNVKVLLETGINIDHINDLHWTALLEAIILGDGGPVYIEIVRLLVNAGADRSIADNDGMSPLAHAERMGYDKIAELLEG